VGLTRVPA